MLPLVKKLSSGFRNASNGTSLCDDQRPVEGVTPRSGLIGDDAKILGDQCCSICAPKPMQLRVPSIAASAAEKYRLRKEGFPPQCNQADAVEMARMQSPKTHDAM